METRWSGYRELSRQQALRVSGRSLLGAIGIAWGAPGLLFQPFWAYGWPGVSPDTIIIGVATFLLACFAMFLASAVLVLFSYVAQRVINKDYVGWGTFGVLMLITLPAVMGISSIAIGRVVAIDWP